MTITGVESWLGEGISGTYPTHRIENQDLQGVS